jgi:ceramide glucosyltransferase
VTAWLAVLLSLLALAGAAQALLAARALARLAGRTPPAGPALAASVLKPLHGAEPGLRDNLAATLAQSHGAPFEALMAVANPLDAAVPEAEAAMAASATPARLLAGGAVLGPNRKVSQLVHLAAAASHPVLVVADADMRCPPEWLTAVTAPLADPDVGLVTCLYRAEPADAGLPSRLAARGVEWHFLPNAALGEALGRAKGCYGATMALRAETLARIGGFEGLLDVLADDNELGARVRALGLRVELSPLLPTHVTHEPSLGALWRHELRWARTVRLLAPTGHAGLAVAHPLPWALLALLLHPAGWTLGVAALALAARAGAAARADRALGRNPLPRLPLLPIRDLLSFAVWATAWRRGGVTWQGRRYALAPDGRMSETTPR